MLARAKTFTIEGLNARPVMVEVDIRQGLPSFAIVGLAGTAVREARDRVQAAILNSHFEFPARRITANLAPGDVPKAGPGLDLALACAILAASGQLAAERLDDHVLLGELALDGRVRPCRGTLAIAQGCVEAGVTKLLLAPARAGEAALVQGLEVAAAETLGSAVRVLQGGPGDPAPAGLWRAPTEAHSLDLSDVDGQGAAVEAMVIAAAGAHNILLSGPPGTGKTMLAERLPTILPPLTRSEAIEVTRIHSIVGMLDGRTLVRERPFRAPHHSTTVAGLVGGRGGWVGEVVLAHRGVLFLDELCEFKRPVLESLRQPVEDGRVAIVRAGHAAVHPSRFMLVAATNPCPCGYAGQERCRCSETEMVRHRRRLSGPLLDRIDLIAHLQGGPGGAASQAGRVGGGDEAGPADAMGLACAIDMGGGASRGSLGISSASARERVQGARERQAHRLGGDGVLVNAQMDAGMLRAHAKLDREGERLMAITVASGMLSARGAHRVLRVARTIADLDGSGKIRADHLGRALALRSEDPADRGSAAHAVSVTAKRRGAKATAATAKRAHVSAPAAAERLRTAPPARVGRIRDAA